MLKQRTSAGSLMSLHVDPLIEQLGRAAIADAPHRKCKAAHAVASNPVVFEAARLAG
jgi:hypothetical protein